MKPIFLAFLCLPMLAACKEELAALPQPVKMTSDALGHYCQMNLSEHPGPKAQVHLKGVEAPIYFAQVRDAIAYLRMPEQSHAVAAVYVNDMAVAPSWDTPGNDNWLAVTTAHFVVGSGMAGGMGAPELVPFSDIEAAESFAARHGGRILGLNAIADADVLTPDARPENKDDTQDFIDRLGHLKHGGNG